jgi:hypothetical protein
MLGQYIWSISDAGRPQVQSMALAPVRNFYFRATGKAPRECVTCTDDEYITLTWPNAYRSMLKSSHGRH